MKHIFQMAVAALLVANAAPVAGAVTVTSLHSFSYDNNRVGGVRPNGSLLIGASGTIYGTTFEGGTNQSGTIFSITSGGTFTTLANLDSSSTGRQPTGRLFADALGTIYGTTMNGGALGGGAVFSLTSAGSLTTLANFRLLDQSFMEEDNIFLAGNIALNASGIIYGTTTAGGANNAGTLFSLTPGGTMTTLASFALNGSGAYPFGNLFVDAAGNVFGATQYSAGYGGGTIFRYGSDGTLTTLLNSSYYFGSDFGGITGDAAGNLYGKRTSTEEIFRLSSDGTYTTLLSAASLGAQYLNPDFIVDSAGTVFGTARGSGYSGSVYSVTSSGIVSTLASFAQYTATLTTGLVADRSGNLYGTSMDFGSGNAGYVYKIAGANYMVSDVLPEPSNWMMMIVGFGMTGSMVRRRRRLLQCSA